MRWLATSVLSLILTLAVYSRQEQANLVLNGDFAHVVDGKPVSWEAAGDPRTVEQTLSVVREGGRTCARLTCTRIAGEGGATHAMLAQVGGVRLRQGVLYELRCKLRQEGIRGQSVSVAITDTSIWRPCGLERSLGVTPQWREYRIPFRATRTVDRTSRLQFWFTETGTLYVSDVSLKETTLQKVEMTETVPLTGSPNLVPNGSFEVGKAGWGGTGIPVGWGDMARLHGDLMVSKDPSHPHYLRIPMGGSRTPILGFDYYLPATRLQTRALAANLRWIPVEPGATYTLSADMRASVDGIRAALGYGAARADEPAWNVRRNGQTFSLTREWKRYSMTFTAPAPWVFVAAGPDLAEDVSVDVDVDNIALTRGREAAYVPYAALQVAVEPEAEAGWFVAGGPVRLLVRVASAAAKAREVSVRLEVRDYYDRQVLAREVKVEVPTLATGTATVTLPASLRGWYGIRVRPDGGSGIKPAVVTPEVLISVVPEPQQRSILGMNHAFPDPWLMRVARQAGISEYRDWSLNWQHIEPEPGLYRWELADAQIGRVLAAGAQVLPLLPPFPSSEWASSAPLSIRREGYPGERLRLAWAPKDVSLLADFVFRAVQRYRDRIRVWEFLNEPIYTDYSLPKPHYVPRDYVELLKPVAEAIRRADPNARVIGGAGAGPGGVTMDMIEAGLLDHVDILNLHIYPGLRAPEGYVADMQRLREAMARLGKERPIWITEFSYYGADNLPRKPFLPDSGDWAQERLLASEKQCSDYTVRFCLLMLANGCEKVFLHSGSSGSANLPAFECCLFDYGGTPRKVGAALGVLAALLGPKPRAVPGRNLVDGAYAVVFETDRVAIAAVWAVEPGFELRVPPAAQSRDLMGRSIRSRVITLGESPVYLTAARGTGSLLGEQVRTGVRRAAAARERGAE